MKDQELEKWQSLWQIDVILPSGLRERAKKQVRRLRMMLWADIVVTVGTGGACAIWAIKSSNPSVRLLATWVWLMLVTAWAFRWLNSGGNWTGAAPNTHVFLERLRKSYRSTLRNIVFGWVLGAVQIVFCSGWVYREMNTHTRVSLREFMTLPANLALWACAAGGFAWSVRLFRKVNSELGHVQQLCIEWGGAEEIVEESIGHRAARLIGAFAVAPSKFEGLDWQLRRKKKSRA